MVASDEVASRGLTVTIKYGKGYEETWAVFRGLAREVRDDILDYFGMSEQDNEKLTLSEVVVNATQLAHAKATVAAKLGAVSIPSTESASASASKSDEAQADPWAAAAEAHAEAKAAEEADPNRALRDTIASISSIPDLKALWADNQAAFSADSALMDAYKARGKALKAATA